MIEYLTPADLDALTDAITAAEAGDTVAQYLLASDGAMSRLLAQARLAPDPDALPLSTAMRMARERTEAGTETWVWVHQHYYSKPYLLRFEDGDTYQRYMNEGWFRSESFRFRAKQVEYDTARLVTPEEGERLLKGEA